MNTLTIGICDDLPEERALLGNMVQAYGQRLGLDIRLYFFASGAELVSDSQRARECQLILLDIYMPGVSGIEAARRLREAGNRAAIIFSTTSTDHGVDSFEVQASDYLVKPIRQESLDQALDWCLEHLPEPLRTLSLYADGEQWELLLSDIRYIEVLSHHCHIHTVQRELVARRGLDELEAAIGSPDFLRCHRSFLVNLNHVVELGLSGFHMTGGAVVPVTLTALGRVRNAYADWRYRKAWECR